ncbi:MAG TPA: glycosyltransferase [Burkholderiales bacterium]|nr:glycosyltransferase [Burkholderiales bacterium]
MKLSIVVPAFNEERLIAATLQRLGTGIELFERRGWSSELIVCDNNSNDRTAELARAAGACVVFEPINQIARARNAGARAASGDWLLFVDADCSPGPELFEDVLAAIESGRYVGGGCTIAMAAATPLLRFWVAAWNALSRMARWAAGAFLFCEAAAFRAAGGFNEELFASEEIDLSRRLKRQGRFVILHRHPLVTSGRKAELYSWREHAAFLLRWVLSGGRNLRRREACGIWYDGRR